MECAGLCPQAVWQPRCGLWSVPKGQPHVSGLSVCLSGLHLASLSQVVADVHAKLRLQGMWQPGHDLWLVPKGSHMCARMRVCGLAYLWLLQLHS